MADSVGVERINNVQTITFVILTAEYLALEHDRTVDMQVLDMRRLKYKFQELLCRTK